MGVRVLIVDDLASFRSAARAVVQSTPGFEVAAEVASGEESIDRARALRPELVLMDVSLPGIDGPEATRRIRADVPDAVVLLLSARDLGDARSLVADCGAAAYIAKATFSSESLASAWAEAREGG